MGIAAVEWISVAQDADGRLNAVRIRRAGRRAQWLAAASVSVDAAKPFHEAFGELCRTVGFRRDRMLVFSPNSCGVFQAETPILSGDELVSALEFEVPRRLLKPPAEWRLACRVFSVDPAAGKQRVLVWAADAEKLEPLWTALRERRWRIDAVWNPFLAVPADFPAGVPLVLTGFQPEFGWRDGGFHPISADAEEKAAAETELARRMRGTFEFAGECAAFGDSEARRYFPALLTAAACLRGEADGTPVPAVLRPRRLRTQLRTMALLTAALLALWSVSGVRKVAEHYDTYSNITGRINASRRRIAELQRKLRSREKELKEMNRVLELAAGNREFLGELAAFSAALPNDMLVTSFKLGDTGVEMNLQTAAENPDLGAALRKTPGFKVVTLQNRRMNDTLTMIDLKLTRQEGGRSK